ncbi:uncharacterized protein LOC114349738 [Ostrinia furnacalis]|uniref:uncharacterized protein LOC114349738 n=1 Tax=Ostrinia furnacalis TaxID=93504 RepID=UPI00103D2B8E|nr:uncharacterized protein LOC114349738 [Ostrinia furnacalis]
MNTIFVNMSVGESPKSFLKGYLFLANVLNSAKIDKLVVPAIVQSGSTNVVLDCQYSVPDHHFTLQWWFSGGDAPVYEWTPPLAPRVTGILKGRLDLSYKVSPLATEEYRAMRIFQVDPQLSGEYTCVVNYNGVKSQETKSMQVLAPEKEFELLFELKFNRLVEVTCYAQSVHPQPDLTVEYNREPISQQTQRVWRRQNLLYDVESTAQLMVPECGDRLEVTCRLHLPQADYTAIKRRLLHIGTLVPCNLGWKGNPSNIGFSLLILFVPIVF